MEGIALFGLKLGMVCTTSGKYREAIEFFKNSLNIYQEKGDQEMVAPCYYSLGGCYRMLDKHSEAVTNYEKSLNIYQERGNLKMIARCYYGLGECYLKLNKYSEAVINYEQSFPIIVNLHLEKEFEGQVTARVGICFLNLNRHQEAKEYIDKALIIAEQFGYWKLEWLCNSKLSDLHYKQKQSNKALDYAERALDIAKKMNSTKEEQMSYRTYGEALALLGKVKEAIDYFERYLKYTKQVGDRKEEGRTFFKLSFCYEKIHEYDTTITYGKKSAAIAKETGDFETEDKAYAYIGSALQEKGKVKEAMEYYIKQLKIATQIGDKELEAIAYTNLGIASMKLGKHYDAIRYFETNVKLTSELGLENNNGAQYNNLGSLYTKVGKYHEAAEFLKQGLDMQAKDTGKISSEIEAYHNLSAVYYKLNNFKLAGEYRLKSIILDIRTGDKRGEMEYYQLLAKCFRETEKIIKAITSHKKALHLTFMIKNSGSIGVCYTNLGTTYFHFGMMDEAVHVYEKGLKIFTDSGDKEQEARSRRSMGMIYYVLAHKQKICNDHVQYARNIKTSEQYLRESIHCYEEMFDDLREKHEFKISIVDTYIEAYDILASLLIETKRTTKALIVCERCRACALGDTLVSKYGMQQQQVFVENMSIRKPLNESDLTDLVPEESSLLFYSIIRDSDMWVLSQQQSLIYAQNDMQKNSITNKNIKKYIKQLVDSAYQSMHVRQMAANCEDRSLGKQKPFYIEGDDDPSQLSNSIARMTLEQGIIDTEYSSSSRNPTESTSIGSDQHGIIKEPFKELFKQLITPVQEHLTPDEIIIIPDGPLNLVPFAALQDPQTGRFLCETKRIRLAPSLTTLKILKECSDDYHSKKGALVIGNPLVGEVMFREEKKTFLSLPNAAMEARVFSSILGVTPLIGIDATKDAVKVKLQENAAVIHIAAHGDDTTGEIALAPGISAQLKAIPEEEDYILTMQEVQKIGVRAKLVVLSCCHSGRGEIRAEGVVGMARAFLAAGARAVVASLWAIDDEATLNFMAGFYMHLRRGKSASVSLNESMKELIREKTYSHPKYWAPFVLIGDDVTIF